MWKSEKARRWVVCEVDVERVWYVVRSGWGDLNGWCVVCRFHLGMDLMRPENGTDEALFKAFWNHGDGIVCCAWKVGGECVDECFVGVGVCEQGL